MKRSVPALSRHHNIKRDTAAVSPVIGAILLILLTVLLAGITVSSVYGKDYVFFIETCTHGSDRDRERDRRSAVYWRIAWYRYEKNFIVLTHKSGDPLFTDSTYIVITGEGGSTIIGTWPHYIIPKGEVYIRYEDLEYGGKESQYASRNADISDGIWSSGERVVLNGEDSAGGIVASSVLVSINGMSDTYNNYGLKQNSIITVKVFDRKTNRIIAQAEHKVTPAE